MFDKPTFPENFSSLLLSAFDAGPAYRCSERPLPLNPRGQRHITLACRLRSALGSAGARDVLSAADMHDPGWLKSGGSFAFFLSAKQKLPPAENFLLCEAAAFHLSGFRTIFFSRNSYSIVFSFYLNSRFSPLNNARWDALVMLGLTPTPKVTLPVSTSISLI